MNTQFQYLEALWLLTILPFFAVLFLLYTLWKKNAVKRIGEPKLVSALYKEHASLKAAFKFISILIAFALGCIALANPRKPDTLTGENRKGIDVLFALDVSNSMLATDVAPGRLQLAKNIIEQYINKIPNDRVGLVLFAGNSYLQMPLTFDHQAAQLFVSTASPAAIPTQGTAIADALKRSEAAFDRTNDRFKTIILITDGETHDEDALKTGKILATQGIMINTVGIGSAVGATIIDPLTKTQKRDKAGNIVVSKLNEALLQQLASATNGQYIHADNAEQTIASLQSQLSQVQKKAMADISQANFTTFYEWLAWPMLLVMIAELFFSDRKRIKA